MRLNVYKGVVRTLFNASLKTDKADIKVLKLNTLYPHKSIGCTLRENGVKPIPFYPLLTVHF